MTDKKETIKEPVEVEDTEKAGKTDEMPKLKGRFMNSIGRRKRSVARVRLYKKGNGGILINGKKASEYFEASLVNLIKQPLKLAGMVKDIDLSIVVKGGGVKGQAEAIRHGIARLLLEMDEKLRPTLRAKGWLTRDARKKERKKPGLKRARRAPQWAKR